jgi:hypothetical protein
MKDYICIAPPGKASQPIQVEMTHLLRSRYTSMEKPHKLIFKANVGLFPKRKASNIFYLIDPECLRCSIILLQYSAYKDRGTLGLWLEGALTTPPPKLGGMYRKKLLYSNYPYE